MKNLVILSCLAVLSCVFAAPRSTLDFDHFWSYDEVGNKILSKNIKNKYFSQISDYLEYLEFEYHDVCHVESYGFTAEGRELKGLHIDTDHDHRGTRSANKEVIFIEAGVRPRYFI